MPGHSLIVIVTEEHDVLRSFMIDEIDGGEPAVAAGLDH